jgi:hypothetical protein
VPKPTLKIACSSAGVVVSWPTNFGGWVLEGATQLRTTNNWSLVTNTPVIVHTNFVVTNAVTKPSQYYRMRAQ